MLDGVAALPWQLGLCGQFKTAVPRDATGLHSISAESKHGELSDSTQVLFPHQYRQTDLVFGQARFPDHTPLSKYKAKAG
jgi:hypothetical protein